MLSSLVNKTFTLLTKTLNKKFTVACKLKKETYPVFSQNARYKSPLSHVSLNEVAKKVINIQVIRPN